MIPLVVLASWFKNCFPYPVRDNAKCLVVIVERLPARWKRGRFGAWWIKWADDGTHVPLSHGQTVESTRPIQRPYWRIDVGNGQKRRRCRAETVATDGRNQIQGGQLSNTDPAGRIRRNRRRWKWQQFAVHSPRVEGTCQYFTSPIDLNPVWIISLLLILFPRNCTVCRCRCYEHNVAPLL